MAAMHRERDETEAECPAKPGVRDRYARLRELDRAIENGSETARTETATRIEVALRAERAGLLAEMRRSLDARKDRLRVLELDPSHKENLFGLGKLLVESRQLKAAQMVYEQAAQFHPGEISFRVNLGSVLLEKGEAAAARTQYETALAIDPDFPQAHGGMYYALTQLGELEAAKAHQRKGFSQNHVFPSVYSGDGMAIPVLLLVSSTGGNTPIEKLIDDGVFQTHVVVADFYDRSKPLPEHRLIVNGIGDADQAGAALDAAVALTRNTAARVLNAPAAVRATGRCDNARRLGAIPGLIAPFAAMFRHCVLAGADGAGALAAAGFRFPVLLRTPGFHMGQHFVRLDAAERLAEAVAELPGAGRPEAEVLAIEYLDARGADGCARKYRAMFVGGKLYPLHLAISSNWKIHYFSADMAERPEHRAEEERFLTDMETVIGNSGMNALRMLQAALALDYGGVDFALSQSGEILLFEANATMVVEQPPPDRRWDYRRAAVERIHAAVRELLMESTGAYETLATGSR